MSQEEYHIAFPMQKNNIENNDVTFVIGNMKCRTYAVVYFILHGFDNHNNELHIVADKPLYSSKRWVVDETYSEYLEEFSISDDILDDLAFIQIELIAIGIDDDNPLRFSQCMLTDDMYTSYHAPNEAMAVAEIKLTNTPFAELYNNRFNGYLQIIRPNKKAFTTDVLTKNDETVLIPHLDNEDDIDKPANILAEYLNQTEVKTTIAMDTFKTG